MEEEGLEERGRDVGDCRFVRRVVGSAERTTRESRVSSEGKRSRKNKGNKRLTGI